ncbi:hypothetical protein HYY75_05750 [bacterium]|nr:hypothetical protein [bacterium]
MEAGNESWKWGMVILLLGVFIFFGSQAYQSFKIASADYPPPDDYLHGDSFDEQIKKSGPSSAHTFEMTPSKEPQTNFDGNEIASLPNKFEPNQPFPETPDPKEPNSQEPDLGEAPNTPAENLEHEKNPDWSKFEDPPTK